MSTLGRYQISIFGADQYIVAWLDQDGRHAIRIRDLEDRFTKLIDQVMQSRQNFVELFRCAMLDSPDVFIARYPDFMSYTADEPPDLDYLRETPDEKFHRYLVIFLQAYNRQHQTDFHISEVEPLTTEIRKQFQA